MTKQTKSAQIIHMLETTTWTREQIAAKVGCLAAYVRVVDQRRTGNRADRRWVERNIERERARKSEYMRNRYANDPEFRRRSIEARRDWRLRNPDYHREYERRYRAAKKQRQSENA